MSDNMMARKPREIYNNHKEERTMALINVVNPTTLYRNTSMPALSLAYLSAYVPGGWKVKIIDETVDKFNPGELVGQADIIGISGGNVCNIERVTRMIDDIEFYDEIIGTKSTVVIGGYVASADPDFFSSKADSVVVGPGEIAIQRLIDYFEKGTLQKLYLGKRIPMNELKKPDFSGFNIPAYGKNINWPVQTSTSCNNTCSFCSARVVFGDGYESAEAGKVLEEIASIPSGERIYFTDPNIINFTPQGIKRAKKLFQGMAKKPHPWYGSVSFKVTEHDDLLALMQKSGCYGLLIGFDSTSPKSLEEINGVKYLGVKDADELVTSFIRGVRKIQEKYGINVLGTFVTGFDQDDTKTFDNIIRLVQQSKMSDAQCMPLTPLPGTELYEVMLGADRIFDHKFAHYDFSEVVFKPMNFAPRDLRNQLARVYDNCYPIMARLYRRLGLLRDRPEEIMIKSVREEVEERNRRAKEEAEKAERERDEARARRARNNTH